MSDTGFYVFVLTIFLGLCACDWMWLFGWVWISLDWLCLFFYCGFMLLNCCYLLFVRLPWWGRVLVCSIWFNSVALL